MTKKNKEKEMVLLQGNQAIAYGALAAGVNFFAGYPITPSTEIAEILSLELPKRGGSFIQMEDEIASISAIIGGSLAGAKTMTATSGPGFSLMQEGIGFARMTETPCVVVNVMRAGPSTGLPTNPSQGDIMQSRWGTHGDSPAIVLYPNSVKESFELTIRAVNLAEKYRTCVVLLSDEVLGHMREAVMLPDLDDVNIVKRIKPNVPPEWYKHYKNNPKYRTPVANFGEGYRFHVTGLAHDELGFPTNKSEEVDEMMDRLDNKIKHHVDDLIQIESFMMDDATTAILAVGITSRAAKAAVLMARKLGKRVGLIRPLTIWPFPNDIIRKYFSEVKTIIVAELNQGQLYLVIKRIMAYKKKRRIVPLLRNDGELITPQQILDVILEGK
ncbi:MAG: 2-oxoacid:acceptor oxidoreductase subunit alpha [Candidatus Cloacimonetes bacterium]|nr:2-oxoacid:acceptor oxidoreductase subunit alpha [Candidatus Cloacimonadota bacterium]